MDSLYNTPEEDKELEKMYKKTWEEIEEENYYYVSDRNVCIAVASQIRNLLKKYTSDKEIANTILNRLDSILKYSDNENFAEYVRKGLQPNKKIK